METSLPACTPVRGISAIPAFKDNYIWLLAAGGQAVVVDPGDAIPVRDILQAHELNLEAILLTHHHGDHVGGVPALATPGVRVFGPATESITGISDPLQGRETIRLPRLGLTLEVLSLPGHTLGHIAYFGTWQAEPVLFCGDTLFGGGCGRLFEGTPEQMFVSLQQIARLPPNTAVYCAHEYTQANLRFALAVEPGNPLLSARAAKVAANVAAGISTVPLSLGEELATNPFLRCHVPEVQASASQWAGRPLADEVAVFAVLREWKNNF